MKTYKRRYKELKSNAYMLIEGYRVQIRQANWHLGWKDLTDKEISSWSIARKMAINFAKELSQLFDYEWKKEYEEER